MGLSQSKIKKIKNWMWDYFDFRYGQVYFSKKKRLLKKSDLAKEDVEMYEEYYDAYMQRRENRKDE